MLELRYCPCCRAMVLQQMRVVKSQRRGQEQVEWHCLVCGTLTARAIRPTG